MIRSGDKVGSEFVRIESAVGVLDTPTIGVGMTYPRGGTEYGGYPGLVQPEPHDVMKDASEQLMLAQMTDAADPESSIESVADDIRRQGRSDAVKQHGRR